MLISDSVCLQSTSCAERDSGGPLQYLKARLGFVGTLLPALGMWSVKQTWKLCLCLGMAWGECGDTGPIYHYCHKEKTSACTLLIRREFHVSGVEWVFLPPGGTYRRSPPDRASFGAMRMGKDKKKLHFPDS